MNKTVKHPLKPFLPEGAKILLLGSFPPDRRRWSMDFYYPNFQNDMWRIFSVVFFGEPNRFVLGGKRAFDKALIEEFLTLKKIAFYDAACEVVRTRNNSADKFLEIQKRSDLREILRRIPTCKIVAATGVKAAENISAEFSCELPALGQKTRFEDAAIGGMDFFRMPSTSRAYPMDILEKSGFYRSLFLYAGVL